MKKFLFLFFVFFTFIIFSQEPAKIFIDKSKSKYFTVNSDLDEIEKILNTKGVLKPGDGLVKIYNFDSFDMSVLLKDDSILEIMLGNKFKFIIDDKIISTFKMNDVLKEFGKPVKESNTPYNYLSFMDKVMAVDKTTRLKSIDYFNKQIQFIFNQDGSIHLIRLRSDIENYYKNDYSILVPAEIKDKRYIASYQNSNNAEFIDYIKTGEDLFGWSEIIHIKTFIFSGEIDINAIEENFIKSSYLELKKLSRKSEYKILKKEDTDNGFLITYYIKSNYFFDDKTSEMQSSIVLYKDKHLFSIQWIERAEKISDEEINRRIEIMKKIVIEKVDKV